MNMYMLHTLLVLLAGMDIIIHINFRYMILSQLQEESINRRQSIKHLRPTAL